MCLLCYKILIIPVMKNGLVDSFIEYSTMCGIHVLIYFVRAERLSTCPTEMCSTTTGYMVAATVLFNGLAAFRAPFSIPSYPFIE